MHTQFKRETQLVPRGTDGCIRIIITSPLYIFFSSKPYSISFARWLYVMISHIEGRVKNENGIQLVTTRRQLYPSLSAVSWVWNIFFSLARQRQFIIHIYLDIYEKRNVEGRKEKNQKGGITARKFKCPARSTCTEKHTKEKSPSFRYSLRSS